jgi:histidinol-phosphate/aromatic aminotransferase/cobyric acid decarboxylase-like protein
MEKPDAWRAYVREVMKESRPFLYGFFDRTGVDYLPGAAHFLLVRPKDRDTAVAFLKDHGILVRPMHAPLIRDTFRMCLGTLSQTRHFAGVYETYHRREHEAGASR